MTLRMQLRNCTYTGTSSTLTSLERLEASVHVPLPGQLLLAGGGMWLGTCGCALIGRVVVELHRYNVMTL